MIAVNVPGFRAPGFYQAGARRGHVGRPLPGVTVRIVDPETFEVVPLGQSGMVVVRGRNVMIGYLGQPALTKQVIRDGWYVTGDIGMMDEDGFLQITDRLSRFSKIGSEMVPHGRVEQLLQEVVGGETPQFAVTAVADDKKGERLMVLTTLESKEISGVLESLARSGLPNLFIPRKDQFITVEKLPVLGTGKLDLREMKRIAMAAATTSRATDTT